MIASQVSRSLRRRMLRVLAPGLCLALSMHAQQPAAAPTPAESEQQEIAALKVQLAEQQRQLEMLRSAMQKQQEAIEKATRQVESAEARIVNPRPSLGEVASTTPILPMPAVAVPNPISGINGQASPAKPAESPLSFPIGGARFTPLGFVDVISIERSTNTGNILGTNFAAIPYSNAAAGNLTENRLSMQNSRIGLRIDSEYKGFKMLGYLESDFLGQTALGGLFQTSNADTLRLRLFFVDIKKGQFELVGGQTWSLMTPNRVGTSPIPGDIFFTQNVDTNYQVGLPWARQTGFRMAWHPNEHVSWAFAAESADQLLGGAAVLPSALNATNAATFGSQFETGAANTSPTLTPDFMTKLALDGHVGKRAGHIEFAALLSTFRDFNPVTSQHFSTIGGGGAVNANLEVAPHFRLITANFFGAGTGRYFQGNAPDFVIRPSGAFSLVRSAGTLDGFEFQATPKLQVYAYYGGLYIPKQTFFDIDGKTPIGYGVPGGAGANKTIQEATIGFVNNFWKNPQYGALSLNIQYSYVTRNPWNIIAPTAPRNANLHMGYVDFRYTLP